jgi:methionyl aminopeptidase
VIAIKNEEQLAGIRESGRLAAEVLRTVCDAVAPGVATAELDAVAVRAIRERGAESAFLNYRGYPGTICVSVNDEVIHGIPGNRVIALGDVVSIDVGVRYGGFCGDNAETVMVGVTDASVIELVETTRRALDKGIAAVAPGRHLSDVSHAIEQEAHAGRCGVVEEFVGHGIGTELHEDPQVPNYGRPGRGPVLQAGMVFCIEPMLNRGSREVRVLPDKWTVVTGDGAVAAHCEHMVAVVPGGVEILTPRG